MIWAFLAMNVCAVMAAAQIRYGRQELAHAAPVAMGPSAWLWTAVAVAIFCILAAAAGRKRLARNRRARRALTELMLMPAAFILVWGFLPPQVGDYSVANWACIAALAAAMVAVISWDRCSWGELGLTGRNFRSAALRLAGPTVLMVVAPIAAAAFVGTDFELHRAAGSLVGYPLYALAQLMVFQVFLVPRLMRLSESRPAVIAAVAALLALAHWPNLLVMAACAVVAAVWTRVYLARPNAYALALSMALAATSFTHALPRDLTHHVRVGPMYVLRAAEYCNAGSQ